MPEQHHNSPIIPEGNEMVIAHLRRLSRLYRDRNDSIRANAFGVAAATIEHLGDTDVMEIEDFTQFEGIGKSSNQEILEFLDNGTTQRLEQLIHTRG